MFAADFEVLLYDLTSTYFEGGMEECDKAKRGYSRDSGWMHAGGDCFDRDAGRISFGLRSDGWQYVGAENAAAILDRIEKAYGQARRVWVMDRGIPTEATLKKMRERKISYLVGTPKGSINKHEKQWLELPGGRSEIPCR